VRFSTPPSKISWILIAGGIWAGCATSSPASHPAPTRGNLVSNGSFEELDHRTGALAYWASAGASTVKQQLTAEVGQDGRRCAMLQCTAFVGDGPSHHAMLAQSGRVAVRRGQWYRLSCWARGEGIKAGAVNVGLRNTRPWEDVGLSDAFTPRAKWERFAFFFRCTHDLEAPNSRLQFWFTSTGTLWLDDVQLTEWKEGQQWYPQIPTAGVKNFLPNSSFECGAANWGSFSSGLRGAWMGNLYRLEGEVDGGAAQHGKQSLKIALSPKTLPIFWFDYYEPIRQPVRRVAVANQGWFRVTPGEKLTLSAYLRADADGVGGEFAACDPDGHVQRKQLTVGRDWKRYEFTFSPRGPFLFIAAGLDLEGSKRDAATMWLDAIQLERGDHATAYEPRHAVESFVETALSGNIFTQPENGAAFTVRAFNNSDSAQTVHGKLALTDFFDHPAFASRPSITLPAHSGGSLTVRGVCKDRRGFFRANWTTPSNSQSLRAAIIDPIAARTNDSPLGFNHAYPWQYLVTLARQAGIVWWRDWSAQWQTIEREEGKLDWSEADAQINRVLELDSQVDVMIPFPSATWSSGAPADILKKAATGKYPDSRMPVAFAPKQMTAFGRFAADVVRHYSQNREHPVQTFQILNESVYTSYALPQAFGYTVDDYIRLLESAYRAMKAANPNCRIVGGCGNPPTGGATREFLEKGGLRFCDVFDVHMYDPPVPAESYEEIFSKIEALMRAHGGLKPMWMTEWGCYADDDPPCIPHSVGDAAMNRSKWPSEEAATEHIVKFVAVAFAHGMRKVFFHAGTCGTINGPDAGGVLFEYGGAPRKMYAGVAALTRLLGTPRECVGSLDRDGLRAYAFNSGDRTVAIAWRGSGQPKPLKLGSGQRAYDVMGNALEQRELVLGGSPVYVVAAAGTGKTLLDTLAAK
jgi:hypothetical protein